MRTHYKSFHKPAENLVYGVHPVSEALQAGREMDRIFIQRDLGSAPVREILELARQAEVPVQKVPVEKLNSLTRGNHQGIVAFTSLITYQPVEHILLNAFEKGSAPLFVILDRITDVRNLGAIARSAECAGADAIIIPSQGSAQVNADAVKTSAGALQNIPVHRSPNIKDTLRYLKDSGVTVVAATEHAHENYYDCDFRGPLALIMGSEEDGISNEYLKLADRKVKIPLLGVTGSLNVSVAAGVMLFEALRQRSIPEPSV